MVQDLATRWERVQQRMKAAVYASMESVADHVEHRPNTFELFGYDFMVCEELDVWLIEVNSSPDLSYSTATTRTLVKQVRGGRLAWFGVRPGWSAALRCTAQTGSHAFKNLSESGTPYRTQPELKIQRSSTT